MGIAMLLKWVLFVKGRSIENYWGYIIYRFMNVFIYNIVIYSIFRGSICIFSILLGENFLGYENVVSVERS